MRVPGKECSNFLVGFCCPFNPGQGLVRLKFLALPHQFLCRAVLHIKKELGFLSVTGGRDMVHDCFWEVARPCRWKLDP